MRAAALLFAAGLGIGFLAGALAFPGDREPLVAPAGPATPATPATPAGPGPGAALPHPDRGGTGTEPARPPVLDTIRTGSSTDLYRLAEVRRRVTGEDYSDEEVRALVERADRALAERDRELFRAVIRNLAAAGTPAAQAKLLEILSDLSVPLHGFGGEIAGGLRDSKLPDIAVAARRRYEAERDAGETSWVAADGWLDLVARYGTDEDVRWVLGLAVSRQIRDQALEAVAGSDHPAAVAELARRVREGQLESNVLGRFAESHPEEARAALEKALAAGSFRDPGQAFRSWASLVTPEDLDRAKSFLLSLRDPARVLQAVRGIEVLRRRGLDLTGLEPMILAPVEILERAATDPEAKRLASSARYAIEYDRVAWSERAASALDRAGYPEEAKKVRAGLSSYWKQD